MLPRVCSSAYLPGNGMHRAQRTSCKANIPAPVTSEVSNAVDTHHSHLQYTPNTVFNHSFPTYLITNHKLSSATLPSTGKISVSAQVRVSSIAESSSSSSTSVLGVILETDRALRLALVDCGVYPVSILSQPSRASGM